ncbi:hypothetical protein Tco_0510566 [Tanacetum coccineum]
MKAQELKTKTSAQTLIYKIFLQRYQVYQGRLLASFQDDAKYEHTKSKDNDKGSRSKITKHEGTSLQRRQRQRSQELNDKSNLIDLMKECHNELTSGEIDIRSLANLKKCLAEPDVQVPLDEIEIDENLRFVKEPIEIVERDVKKLKRKRIPLVKVRWNSRQGAEYT